MQAKLTTILGACLIPLGVVGSLAAGSVCAQPEAFLSTDVPYVPTPQVTVDEMLRLANVGPQDFVLDLGSGDGRIVITAARKFGARGLGVDLDFHLVIQSEGNAQRAGVEDRANFLQQDLFKTDLAQATVITMYLLPSVTSKLRPRLLELKPGTRIVSHDFDLQDWKPDRKTYIRKNVFLWIVPAKVAGRWQATLSLPPVERQLELILEQRFQEVSTHARLNGVPTQAWETRLEGERISLAIVDSTDRQNEATLYFEGRVSGDVIEGNVVSGAGSTRTTVPWRAVRIKP